MLFLSALEGEEESGDGGGGTWYGRGGVGITD